MSEKEKVNVELSESDYEILKSLYKCSWLHDYHLAAIIGENHKNYVRGRQKKLTVAGLVKRKMMKSGMPAVNWLTQAGMRELGLPVRNVNEPKLYNYEHDLGCADMYVYLCLLRKKKDGSFGRLAYFGEVITERDFNAVSTMREINKKSNGQPIYVRLDRDIHKPDGYLKRNNMYIALEFERTPKSKKRILRDNVLDNAKRFAVQYWVYSKPSVYNALLEIQQELGSDKIKILDIEKIRRTIQRYVDNLPPVISKKSGKPRVSNFGEMVEPIPLNKIPLIATTNVQLERRN